MISDETKMHLVSAEILRYKPFMSVDDDTSKDFLYWLGVGRFDESVQYNFITGQVEHDDYEFCLFCKTIYFSNVSSTLIPVCIGCEDKLNALPNQMKMHHHLSFTFFLWIIHTLGIDTQRKLLYNLASRCKNVLKE